VLLKDLAEIYPTNDSSITSGEVVALDPTLTNGIQRSSKPYDTNVLGVVATKPAMVIGNTEGNGIDGKPVALSGRAPVKVSTENGSIKSGDVLTSSSIPGVAMKATKAGPMIGIAMHDYSGEDQGAIMVFVKTGYFTGANLADIVGSVDRHEFAKQVLNHFINQREQLESAVDLSEIVTDRISAGLEVIAPRVVVDEVMANSIAPVDKDLTVTLGTDGRFILASQSDASSSAQPMITFDSSGNAVFAGTLMADKIRANQIIGLEFSGGEASSSGNIFSFMAILEDSITFITRVVFRSPVEYFAEVVFHNRVVFDTDTAGRAVIAASTTTVTVPFEKPFTEPPIVTISLNLPEATDSAFLADAVRAAVSGVTRERFTIVLDAPVPRDLTYNWVALAVKNARSVVGKRLGEGGSIAGSSIEVTPTPSEIPSPTPTVALPTPTLFFTPTLTPTPIASRSGQTVTVLSNELGYVRMREAPNIEATESGAIPSGSVVPFTEVQYGWYHVVYETLTGWMSGTYISVNP